MIELCLFCIGFIVEVCRLLIDFDEKEKQPKLRFWVASGILSGFTVVCVCLMIPFFFVEASKDINKLEKLQFSAAIIVGIVGWIKIRKVFIDPLIHKLEKKVEQKVDK